MSTLRLPTMHDRSSLIAITESFSEEMAQSLATFTSTLTLGRRRGPVVRVLGLHVVSPCSNPLLICQFPVVPDSTLPRFVNSQLVASCQLGFLIVFLLSLNCFFEIIKSGVPVN